MIPALFSAAAGFALLYLVVFCYRGPSWSKTVVKTMAVLLLGGCAWWAQAPGGLVAALVLCAIGDFLLSRDDDSSFLAGVGAFALGHVAYIWLFLGQQQSGFARLATFPQLLIVVFLVLLGAGMARILLPRAGDLAVAVAGYIPIICGMGIAALTLPVGGEWGYLLPGAMLFVLSDFILSLEMFVLPEGAPMRRYTPFFVWASYWGAQVLLLLSFV